MVTNSRTYARPQDLGAARAEDGTLYVMALPDGVPLELNHSAEVIWEVACSGSERIVQEVAEAFEVDPSDIAGLVAQCLDFLIEHGLVEASRSHAEEP